MIRKVQITLDFESSIGDLEKRIKKELNYSKKQVWDYRILSKSLDARGANLGKRPSYHYVIEVITDHEKFSIHEEHCEILSEQYRKHYQNTRPVIVGAGPAGLFCALRLAEYGISSIIIERGPEVNERMKLIAKFWRYGEFNPEGNVCFGEGGAGLFSDGKLITRIKDPFVGYVMKKLVSFGAPKETAYYSNPHLGSNKIRKLISALTEYLRSKGCEFYFNTKVEKFIFDSSEKKEGLKNSLSGVITKSGKSFHSSHIILAVGHSAKKMYQYLADHKIALEHKDFAVGVRVEHLRKDIDKIQYGDFALEGLSSSKYRLSYHNKESAKGTYSFCMCPGGYVLSSGTEGDGLVVNGMSNYKRNSPWSNSALVVSVKKGKDFSEKEVMSGVQFQSEIEKKAYLASVNKASGKEIPAQMVKDFLEGRKSHHLVKTSCPSKVFSEDLTSILPPFINEHLRTALYDFDKKMKGFISDNAMLLAPETRTSAPLTIKRDRISLESDSHKGLYPCGEGAGYAGGITSAAVDGVKVAEAIVKPLK